MDADEARLRIAGLCSQLAELSGDGRFATAAGILSGNRQGRRAIDDRGALEMAKGLIDTGASTRSACKFVAQIAAPTSYNVEAMAARLRRKLKQK